MQLLTKQIEQLFKKTGDQSDSDNPLVICKFFDPMGSWTWYATEYNPKDKIFFGYVMGFENEWGTFSLTELESIAENRMLGIERDIYFTPCKFKELKHHGKLVESI